MTGRQGNALRIIFICAHPDDADIKAGGTAALFAERGHRVKFVSVTNGEKGHYTQGGARLVRRRHAETQEAARRLGIAEYEVLDYRDGELMPTVDARNDVIRLIREWDADVVAGHHPQDYHPDHRYGSKLVQDAAYMVQVPNVLPAVTPTDTNPLFLYVDCLHDPDLLRHDIAIAIDAVHEKKVDALDAHASQVYEWLPWANGTRDQVPEDEAQRKQWLAQQWSPPVSSKQRRALDKWYGMDNARQVQYAESFEIAAYGHQPTEEEIRRLFPMLG